MVGFLRLPVVCWRSEASFSTCGQYRWELQRAVSTPAQDERRRVLLFVGLNPSRADADRDDPTLRRLQGFAQAWGHHQLVVLNLFARISPAPVALRRCADPVGENTDRVLIRWFQGWASHPGWDLWLGWGAAGGLHQRDQQVVQMLKQSLRHRRAGTAPLAMGTTRSGQPRHPLYLSSGSSPTPWTCTVR
ncbi:DUF1643 domain-containing protein [Synechococcus sp. A15-60]|uniref:DUF1643 domain-containing protein n=1 Tax=Synechococcus sp. A15-60 TaxID=1050655 RepID=UPI002105FF2A|nr:DUF1643 domain-containing protein [Synechococcus sp. A15-60]